MTLAVRLKVWVKLGVPVAVAVADLLSVVLRLWLSVRETDREAVSVCDLLWLNEFVRLGVIILLLVRLSVLVAVSVTDGVRLCEWLAVDVRDGDNDDDSDNECVTDGVPLTVRLRVRLSVWVVDCVADDVMLVVGLNVCVRVRVRVREPDGEVVIVLVPLGVNV